MARKPLGASATSVLLVIRTTQLPIFCRSFFSGEKCSISADRTRADHHVGLPGQHRRRQLRDIGRTILVVGIGVDDDVGIVVQAGIEPRHEGTGQTTILVMAHDVIDAALDRDPDRLILAPVVYDQPFDAIEPRHVARKLRQGDRQCLGLVVARDLDDELRHCLATRALFSTRSIQAFPL